MKLWEKSNLTRKEPLVYFQSTLLIGYGHYGAWLEWVWQFVSIYHLINITNTHSIGDVQSESC